MSSYLRHDIKQVNALIRLINIISFSKLINKQDKKVILIFALLSYIFPSVSSHQILVMVRSAVPIMSHHVLLLHFCPTAQTTLSEPNDTEQGCVTNQTQLTNYSRFSFLPGCGNPRGRGDGHAGWVNSALCRQQGKAARNSCKLNYTAWSTSNTYLWRDVFMQIYRRWWFKRSGSKLFTANIILQMLLCSRCFNGFLTQGCINRV